MIIEIPLHSIILAVAPSGAGKTHFFQNVLIPQLKEKYDKLNVQYISSDEIRRILIGGENHKHDNEMSQVSGQAFEMLDLRLKLATSFSVTAEVIIIDTTGLSEVFRDEVIAHGKETNYNVIPLVFDYDTRDEYFLYQDELVNKFSVAKQITRLKKEVLKTLTKKKYHKVLRIKSKDFSEIEIIVKDYDFYCSHFLPEIEGEYCVISDVHGCLDQLKTLIVLNDCAIVGGSIISGDKVFIVQDYLDKGYDIIGTLKFIYNNWKNGRIVPLIGNHENYVYKRITNQIVADDDLDNSYFNSVPLLLDDEEAKAMFIELFEASRHFYKHKDFFVNHAPCAEKYLSKIDNESLKRQRNFRYPKRFDVATDEEYLVTLEESLNFIQKYENWSAKPVVWGHIAIKNTLRVGNVYMIDTGCVSGNKLSSITFCKDGRTFVKVVPSYEDERIVIQELPVIFKGKIKKDVLLENLDPEDYRRIRYLIYNKINYISGTMCPADKDLETNELESLKKGLEYYQNSGISRVILQKKYMGSNSINYINADIEKCYSTSRNGYFISEKRVDLKSEYSRIYGKLEELFKSWDAEYIIINSELMPWSALGKGLIEESYMPVQIGTSSEYDLLKDNGFEVELSKLLENPLLPQFKIDIKNIKKQDLIEKYSYRGYETLKNVNYFMPEYISPEQYKNGMDIFKKQLELFGGPGEPKLLPFNILKVIKKNGEEIVFMGEEDSNLTNFTAVSDDDFKVIDFSDIDYLEQAQKFYDSVTVNEQLEGVVIKPEYVYKKGVAPALKCRNKNYLTLTYGFDYQKDYKYNKLINKKHISRKLKASISEFEIGKKMLEIPLTEVVDGNQHYINTVAAMILDEKIVKRLDPRL